MMANSEAHALAAVNRLFLIRTLRSCRFYFGNVQSG